MPELDAVNPTDGSEPGLFGYRYFWFLTLVSTTVFVAYAWWIRAFDMLS